MIRDCLTSSSPCGANEMVMWICRFPKEAQMQVGHMRLMLTCQESVMFKRKQTNTYLVQLSWGGTSSDQMEGLPWLTSHIEMLLFSEEDCICHLILNVLRIVKVELKTVAGAFGINVHA